MINDVWYKDTRACAENEAERIATAAKLILGNIWSAKYDWDYYPTNEDIESIEQGKS
jgi:hypothetical protein